MKKIFLVFILMFLLNINVYAETADEVFDKLLTNGVLEISAIKPETLPEEDFYINSYIIKTLGSQYAGSMSCNEDLSKCNLNVFKWNEFGTADDIDTREVKVVWKENDLEAEKIVDDIIKKIDDKRAGAERYYFDVTDLNVINYHYNSSKASYDALNNAINFSTELKELVGSGNIFYLLDNRAGDGAPFVSIGFGGFTLYYDNVIYGLISDLGTRIYNVLYVPDNTENTSDAYIAAVQKRIDEYLGKNKAKVEVGGKLEDYEYCGSLVDDFSHLGDESKMGDYYYKITMGNSTYDFIIIRDSSKMQIPTHSTTDIKTNITISSDSSEVPLDTMIKANVIDKNHDDYKKIVEKLKVNDVQIYDLKLFSNITQDYISKLLNGNFMVTVPIDEKLRDKVLYAYYIDEKNDVVEKYPIKITGNYGTFETKHFSVYTIAEDIDALEKEESSETLGETNIPNVPKTFDGLQKYTMLVFLSVIGVIVVYNELKKQNR